MAEDAGPTELLKQITKNQERAIEALNDISETLVDIYNLRIDQAEQRRGGHYEYQVFHVPANELDLFHRQLPELGNEGWILASVVTRLEPGAVARDSHYFYFHRWVQPRKDEETEDGAGENPAGADRPASIEREGKAVPKEKAERKRFLQGALNRKLCLECGQPLSTEIGVRMTESRNLLKCLNCGQAYGADDYVTRVAHLLDLLELEGS